MKNYRKIFITGILFTVVITANAQLDWGIKAGVNLSAFSGFVAPASEVEQSILSGFHAGLTMQYMFTSQMGIETGLLYSILGSKITGTLPNVKGECTLSPSYLQLPVSLLYKLKLADDLYLYPSLGLYAGYGMGGKWKAVYSGSINLQFEGNLFKEDAPASNPLSPAISADPIDFGFTAGLTFQVNRITLGFGFEQGLSQFDKELAPQNIFGEGGWSNQNIRVSLGFFF